MSENTTNTAYTNTSENFDISHLNDVSSTPQAKNSFESATKNADISAFENVDLSLLNTEKNTAKPTEERLEKLLIKIVVYAKICAWVGISIIALISLYGWTRGQSQSSWLMSLPVNTASSPLCRWMNRGADEGLRKDSTFRDYLTKKGNETIPELIDNGHCIALDTIETWLGLQKTFASEELGKIYEKIIPKKFLGATIMASPELAIITVQTPEHRMHHDVVLQIVSEATLRMSDGSTRVTCDAIEFRELSAEVQCRVTTKSPIQPRAKAIDFINSLSKTQSLLVIYPNMLDMQLDEKTNTLTTEFSVQMNYIPSRYEAGKIQKLTYDKR